MITKRFYFQLCGFFTKSLRFGNVLVVGIVEMIKRVIILSFLCLLSLNIFSVTKTALHAAELKNEIREYIAQHYEGFVIRESYKVNSNGVILFEVTVVRRTERLLLIFNKEGLFVSQKIIITPGKYNKVGTDKRKG